MSAFITFAADVAAPKPDAILQELREFREMGTVLYVAAHPDDENTLLIGYLARGRNYRTAYLSVTRGDGGQNVLGPEFGDKLGVARTQELLAARRLDGGRQFFTRAIDFGFSKDYLETLRIWDKEQVLGDMVRVIRTFRPDVIITRFSTQPGGTHGHHTASAVLALEAFKLAGDPKVYPEQLDKLTPWQPKRILCNGRGDGEAAVKLEISGNDPVTGLSFGDLAGKSRSMHKTQGFGNFGGRGGRGGSVTESFTLLAGEPATNDIMDGVVTTWGRIPGASQFGILVNDVIARFNTNDPAASVPALLELKTQLAALPKWGNFNPRDTSDAGTAKASKISREMSRPPDPILIEKSVQLDHILQACLGLSVQTTIPRAEVVPGETMKLHHTVTIQSSVPVRWSGVRYPAMSSLSSESISLRAGEPASRDISETLPVSTPPTQPYWLRDEAAPGMFRVDDPSLIGTPENAPPFPIEYVFEVGEHALVVRDEPVQADTAAGNFESRRKLEVISPVSLHFSSGVKLFSPNATRTLCVNVVANRESSGVLQLDVPPGWTVKPETKEYNFAKAGDWQGAMFSVTAPAQPGTGRITARAKIGDVWFSTDREEINYKHIPRQLLQPPASTKAVNLDLAIRGKNIGYLPGAGDDVELSLINMGYGVKQLTGGDLTTERLASFDAVVIGVRAFNVRADLAAGMSNLFAYVEAGGTVIEQYNRPDGLKVDKLAPYDLTLSSQRVTDETAPVTFLAPDHPALNTPNKIVPADFDGWVQERGIYYPNHWDAHFTPILASGDPGEKPLEGGLLVAKYGRGYFVYTGLVFFRQLPAGVPGAYRLFANLVSLGK